MKVTFFRSVLRVYFPDHRNEVYTVHTRSKNIEKLKLLLYEQNVTGFTDISIINLEKITVNVPYSVLENLNDEQN